MKWKKVKKALAAAVAVTLVSVNMVDIPVQAATVWNREAAKGVDVSELRTYHGEGFEVWEQLLWVDETEGEVKIEIVMVVDGNKIQDMSEVLDEIFSLPWVDKIYSIQYYNPQKNISKKAMQRIVEKVDSLVIYSSGGYSGLVYSLGINDSFKVTSDFEIGFSVEKNVDISNLIEQAGVKGATCQFTIAGSGSLPGEGFVGFGIPVGTLKGASEEKYIYQYVPERGAFELVSNKGVYAEKCWLHSDMPWLGGEEDDEYIDYIGCDGLTKAGTYVVSDEKFPDSIVTDSTSDNDANRTVPYYSLSADGGTWDGSHYTKTDGTVAKDVFFFDGSNTYYLQADGTPMKDKLTYHPDGEHIIYLDSNGHEVFNSFQYCPSVGYTCYFDSNGYIYKDQITFVGDKTYYLNGNGKMENEGWFQFANGRDFGYANWDGTLNTGGFSYDPWGRVVFYHWNGMVARGLITDGLWYYLMDETDGHYLGSFSVN